MRIWGDKPAPIVSHGGVNYPPHPVNPYQSPQHGDAPGGAVAGPYGGPPGSAVSSVALDHLRSTRPWVMLLGILGFLAAGLMLLAGLGMLVFGAAIAQASPSPSPVPVWAFGFIYLPLAFVYIYPSLKLWQYAQSIARLNQSAAASDLEEALGHQKSFWKFIGIFTVVGIVAYIVAILAAVALGFLGAMSQTAP